MIYDDGEQEMFSEGNTVILHRGCKFDRESFLKQFQNGDYIVFPAFTSTSIDEEQAKLYGKLSEDKRILFRISCRCTKRLIKTRAKSLQKISKYPEEKEFLLNCFSLFKISEINEDYDGYLLYCLDQIQ